jgi:hypothetical protein
LLVIILHSPAYHTGTQQHIRTTWDNGSMLHTQRPYYLFFLTYLHFAFFSNSPDFPPCSSDPGPHPDKWMEKHHWYT